MSNSNKEYMGELSTVQKAFELACNLISELYMSEDVYKSLDKTMPKDYTEESAWIEYFTDLAKEVEAFNKARLPETSFLCPLCGGENLVYMTNGDNYEEGEEALFKVVCDMKQGGCGCSSGYFPTKKEALKAWERRM